MSWNGDVNDKHPRSRHMYRKYGPKREDQERFFGPTYTPIYDGDWKVNVTPFQWKGMGYRRYHRHGKRWFVVISARMGEREFPTDWKCGHCGEPVPDSMEGYINLAQWATDAN